MSSSTTTTNSQRKEEAKKALGAAYSRTLDAATNLRSRWERRKRRRELEKEEFNLKHNIADVEYEEDDDREPLIAADAFDDDEHEPLVGH